MKKRICAVLVAIIIVFGFCATFSSCAKSQVKENTKYDIKVVYDEKNNVLDGQMSVRYVNNSDAILDDLYFHLYPNAYRQGAQFSPIDETEKSDAYPNGESWGNIQINSVRIGSDAQYEIGGEDEDILVVRFPKEVEPTQKVTIEIDFKVTLANVRHRLGYFDGVVNCGNWYPIACVKKEVGFDAYPYYSNGDPFTSDCADYSVTISVPSTKVVATGANCERRDSGVVATYSCNINNVRDFAFVIGDFKTKSAKIGNTQITYFYRKDTDPEDTLKCANDAISYFSKTLIQYPYSNYAVVETPFISGGMEYPTLVYVSDNLNRSLLQEAVVHETAHQWWYSLVGNNQVEHAWMDEGLSEYSTTLFYEAHPDYGVSYKARMSDATGAYVIYSSITTSDGVMDKKVNEFTHYDYTYLTYLKGALMFDAVRKSVPNDAFFKALKNYANQYAYSIATPDQMISSFEKSTSRPLRSVFESFLYGKAQIF